MNAPPPATRPHDPPASAFEPRLGTLDSGPFARAGRGATARTTSAPDAAEVTVEWWIGAEDRWHRPATDASTRDRLVDGRPVAEARVRIPSGDAVGTVAAGRLDGSPLDAVLLDVHNDSPLPVALAYVVTADRPLVVEAGGVVVPGVGVLRLTRPALGWASGASAEEVLSSLDADVPSSPPEGEQAGRVVAVLVPLPHTAHGVAAFELDREAPGPAANRPVDRARVPGPDRIAAGWSAHLDGLPAFDPGTPADVAAYEAAVCDLLLGPDGTAESAEDLGRRVEALARIGRTDDPTSLVDLLDLRRSGGAVGPRGDGRMAATLQFVRALSAWVTAVGPGPVADELVGPLVQAAHWTAAPRRADAAVAAVDRLGRAATGAWGGAVAVLAPAGQPDAAEGLAAVTAARRDAAAPPATAPTRTPPNAAPGGAADGAADGAAAVIAHLERAVSTVADGLLVAPGWAAHDAGAGWEAHGISTPWGLVSFAIRWHGERPALLWEIDAPPARVPAMLRAPALDPSWSSTAPRGEALLAPVEGRWAPDAGTGQTEAPEGGSFS